MDGEQPVSIFESLCWSSADGYADLPMHLSRLAHSCAYFDIAVDMALISDKLAAYAREVLVDIVVPVGQVVKVRLDQTLSAVRVTHVLVPCALSEPLPVVVCNVPVDSADVYLVHKTGHRHFYQAQFARYRARGDYYDVLFVNERGELTEGTFNNVLVQLACGQWVTPPVSCGLLPGIARAKVLADDVRGIEERVVPASALAKARAVVCINSVRGEQPVYL